MKVSEKEYELLMFKRKKKISLEKLKLASLVFHFDQDGIIKKANVNLSY